MHGKGRVASARLQELGRGADQGGAQSNGRRQGAGRCFRAGTTEAGTWWTLSIRWRKFLPLIGRIAGTGAAAAERRHDDGQAGGPRLWPLAALHHGLEQCGRLNREHCARRKQRSIQPVLSRPVERLVRGHHFCASLHTGRGSRARPAYIASFAMNSQVTPEPEPHASANWRRFIGDSCRRRTGGFSSIDLGQLVWARFRLSLVSWFDALNSWRHGIPYPHWTPSANYGAGEPRFVFYSPLTWMLGAALARSSLVAGSSGLDICAARRHRACHQSAGA